MPQPFRRPMLFDAGGLEALQVGHKVIPALVAEEKRIRRHDGGAADLGGIVEMRLQPQRRTAPANLRKVRALTPVSDQRRTLLAKLLKRLSRPPQQNVGRVRTHEL